MMLERSFSKAHTMKFFQGLQKAFTCSTCVQNLFSILRPQIKLWLENNKQALRHKIEEVHMVRKSTHLAKKTAAAGAGCCCKSFPFWLLLFDIALDDPFSLIGSETFVAAMAERREKPTIKLACQRGN